MDAAVPNSLVSRNDQFHFSDSPFPLLPSRSTRGVVVDKAATKPRSEVRRGRCISPSASSRQSSAMATASQRARTPVALAAEKKLGPRAQLTQPLRASPLAEA